jgi:hypothetical protein
MAAVSVDDDVLACLDPTAECFKGEICALAGISARQAL